MIPKDLVNAIKVFEKHGFNIANVKKAVLEKAQKQLDGISKKKEKPKPVIKSVEKKTDEQLIAEHIQSNGVTKERKGPAKYWDGVKWCDYNNDILGKKEIASRVKLPFTDLTVNIVLIMIGQDWLSCRQITEAHFGKENFNNTLDKEGRIEIYKLEDRKFIDKSIEHSNRHYYKLNKLGLEFINRKTGGR